MARTLRDDMADDFAAMLVADEFAEPCVYLPQPGVREVQLRAICRRGMQEDRQRPDEMVRIEPIDVRIGNDPERAGGGIERPAIGDGLVRDGDQRDQAYSLTNVLGSNSHSWLLRFERQTPIRVGNSSIQR